MTPLREWLNPPRTLLLSLFLLTLVSVGALAWSAWRLAQQQRAVEQQQSQEKIEQIADRVVANLRGALAESGDHLGDGENSVPPSDGRLFLLAANRMIVEPPGRLLYYPVSADKPEADLQTFSDGEFFEFDQKQPNEALAIFQKLAASKDPAVRAGALVRVARVLRNTGDLPGARAAYQALLSISSVQVADTPADLLAKFELAELFGNKREASDIRAGSLQGRWHLTKGQFEYYWAHVGGSEQPPANAVIFSEAAALIWDKHLSTDEIRGQETLWILGQPLLFAWRGSPEHRFVLVSRPEPFLRQAFGDDSLSYWVSDAQGKLIAGQRHDGSRPVVRTATDTHLPWTLYISGSGPSANGASVASRRFLILGTSVMVSFLLFGAYFIARAIRKEMEVMRMQADFVSVVSHEFRSPLTSMRQLSEMLSLGRVPSEERRHFYYETMLKETSRLQRLVEALLNFGRMEAGVRQYRFEELDAAKIIRGVASEFEAQVADTGRRIELNGPDSGCNIEADPEALSVALRNLVDNAVKYSPQCPTVWVEWSRKDEFVAIQVRDQGSGITVGERKRIFKKFVRGTAATATNAKGSGVGLATVSHIVAAHGGQIQVASEAGRGSIFTILLPKVQKI